MKNKVIVTACTLLAMATASAQNAYDAEKLLGNDLNGTARFVGMGGAMGALGGDISVMSSNPAGIGSLISKVIYVKQGTNKQFAILDAGMTDLIRPALYQAYHKIENITSEEPMETYDVVGPICESSDVFGKAIDLNKAHRGDLFALRSAGAYGEIMASAYNCRALPKGYTSEELV